VARDPRHLDLEGLIRKLRSITLTVQLIPFIYSALYIVSLFIYYFGSDSASQVTDSLLYISPLAIGCFLVLSDMLRLCKWHKAACCVPLIPSAISLFDYYLIELSEIASIVGVCTIAGMILLLLISAYKVFLC